MQFKDFLQYYPICPICLSERNIICIFDIFIPSNKETQKYTKNDLNAQINYRLAKETKTPGNINITLSKYNQTSNLQQINMKSAEEELLFQYLPDFIFMDSQGNIEISRNENIQVKSSRITVGCKNHYFYYGIVDFFSVPLKINNVSIDIESVIIDDFKILNNHINLSSLITIDKNTYNIPFIPLNKWNKDIHSIKQEIERKIKIK